MLRQIYQRIGGTQALSLMQTQRDVAGLERFPSVQILTLVSLANQQQFAVKGGHFIKEDLGAFDARFFSISPEEAMAMDPHQRIILEETYRAFENGK